MEIVANGKILNLSKPVVMGVLNLNNDSFYAASRVIKTDLILAKATEMINEGAQIIDIGAVSTRPGSVAPSVDDEIHRLRMPLQELRKAYPEIFISVDTYRSDVLEVAIDIGIDIINDVSAGSLDNRFFDVVQASKLPYILMHMRGQPENMQVNPSYIDRTLEILSWFKTKIYELRRRDVVDIIVDPGFGFGKSVEDNFGLLQDLSSFMIFDCPILVGLSRKSMLQKLLNNNADESLNATSVANTLALSNGANILRVHDVNPAMEAIEIFMAYKGMNANRINIS